jgi:hypothetical protein
MQGTEQLSGQLIQVRKSEHGAGGLEQQLSKSHIGVTDPLVAVDGYEQNCHRIRRLYSKEYLHLCGFNHAKEQRSRWEVREPPARKQLTRELLSMKTADVHQLRRAIEYRLINFGHIVEPYDRVFRYRHLAITNYRERQRV